MGGVNFLCLWTVLVSGWDGCSKWVGWVFCLWTDSAGEWMGWVF